MPKFNGYGEVVTTQQPGNALHGNSHVDGTDNIVINNGSTYTGRFHPSGATNAVVVASRAQTNNPNGSANIILSKTGSGYTFVG